MHNVGGRVKTGDSITLFLQKDTRTVAISFKCQLFGEKLEDIKMILQLSKCLSATNIIVYYYVKKTNVSILYYVNGLCNTTVVVVS